MMLERWQSISAAAGADFGKQLTTLKLVPTTLFFLTCLWTWVTFCFAEQLIVDIQ